MNRLLNSRLLRQLANLPALNHGRSNFSLLSTSIYAEIDQNKARFVQSCTRCIPISGAYRYNTGSRNMSSVSKDTTSNNGASTTTVAAKGTSPAASAWKPITSGKRKEQDILNVLKTPLVAHKARKKGQTGLVGEMICAAYCLPSGFLLDALRSRLPSYPEIENIQLKSEDVLHLRIKSNSPQSDPDHGPGDDESGSLQSSRQGHLFIFGSGSLVFWGIPESQRFRLIEVLLGFTTKDEDSNQLEMSDFNHEFGLELVLDSSIASSPLPKPTEKPHTQFRNDTFYVCDFDNVEELLAASFGLAQSVKLLVYEEAIDSLVERTRQLPRQLALTGNINMPPGRIKQIIGELLAARYSVNLVSDILDTPEYFWDHPEAGNLFFKVISELDLSKRASILDKRMQTIKDVLDVLNNELASSSSSRIERAILYLIAVEVVIMLFGKGMGI